MPYTPGVPSLSYALAGPARSKALVFLNGLGGVKEAWFYQVRHLKEHHRILTFDSRGAGASQALDVPTTMADFGQDVVDLLDHVGLERVTLVGISFGGRIAQQVVLSHPERVEGLVLVATACGPAQAGPAHDALRRAPSLDERGWLDQVVPVLFGPRYIAREAKRLEVFARSRARLPSDPVGLRWQWEAYEGFQCCDRLAEIDVPTLILQGEDDVLCSVANARRLAAGIRGSMLRLLPGVGHSPHVEDAPRFNRLLSGYLGTHERWDR